MSLSPSLITFCPICSISSSADFTLCSIHSFEMFSSFISILACFRNSLSISSPCCCVSLRSLLKIASILALAFAVVAKLTQSGCTFCDFDVRISTWSPLCSLWLRGTNLWLTFAPIQWLPRNVCIENAKSSAVQFCGMVLISPLGVNTNISEAKRFSLIVSRKSRASGCGSSRISFMVCSHLPSSPSSSLIPPSLYFQCAANPCSAISSILSLLICTSIHLPLLLISVTCSAW